MKKRNKLLLILLGSTIFACSPKATSPSIQQNNRGIPEVNSTTNQTNRSEQNSYEQYIHQWPDKRGVTIDLNINEMGVNDNLWIVEAQILSKNSDIFRPGYASRFLVPGTIKFNILAGIDMPIPLIVPIKEHNYDLFPHDPVVIYNDGLNSTQVDISYELILRHIFKQQDVSAYFDEEVSTGRKELAIYIYRLDSTYENYKDNDLNLLFEQHAFTANVKDVIELQRFPM